MNCLIGIFGLIVGCVLTSAIFYIRHPVLGHLEVDESDVTDVKWRFVITKEIEFDKQRFIFLKVINRTHN